MQEVYEKAHHLARAIEESEENRRYLAARAAVMGDDAAVEMIQDFRHKQLEYHARQLGGENLKDEDREALARLRETLEMHPEVREFLDSEVRLVQMITDVQSILADSVSLELEESPGEE